MGLLRTRVACALAYSLQGRRETRRHASAPPRRPAHEAAAQLLPATTPVAAGAFGLLAARALEERLGLLAELRGQCRTKGGDGLAAFVDGAFLGSRSCRSPEGWRARAGAFRGGEGGRQSPLRPGRRQAPCGGAQQQAAVGQGSMPAPGEGSTAPAKPTGVFMASISSRSQGLAAECTSWLHNNCRGDGGRRPSPACRAARVAAFAFRSG